MECYDAVNLILENGTFTQWEPNTAQGWQVEVIAANELRVTHTNGFLPNADQLTLTFWHYRPGGAPDKVFMVYDDQCNALGCEVFGGINLPGCGEGSIQGVVYRECNGMPFSNQPTLEEQTVELWDDSGNFLGDQETGPDGIYQFDDLPPGNYIVRLANKDGWTPNIPASGEYVLSLLPEEVADREFGTCPICTCDNWEILLSQEPVQNDTAFVDLAVYALWEPCRYRMHIAIDSGEIVGVTPPLGWEALIIDPLHAELTVISEEWWNQMNPDILQSSIAVDYGIKEKGIKMTVTIVGEGNAMPEPMCMDSIILEDPTKYVEYTCCPDGKTAGPEMVVDGQFVGPGLPASDYTPWVSGPTNQGEIAIFNMNGAYAANNNWVCPGFGGAADTYLAVDGHGTPNQAAWKQQITGLTAGAEYQFCTLVANLVSAQKNFDDPVIILEIVDDINPVNSWQSAPLIVPESPKQWLPHTLAWTAPSPVSTSYTLRILSTVQDAIGNDFALDRVSFRECITVPPDTCCKDLAAFCADLVSLITFDPDSCKVTMDLGALPLCYTIEWVDWGQGPEFGPWTSSTFPQPMHTFSGNGTYPISYLAIAYNDSNFICIEKIVEDTIEVLCEPCLCNDPMMTLQLNGVDYPLTCAKGAPLVQLPCPAGDLTIFGFFGCEKSTGDLCEETVANYTLTGPKGIVNSGSTTPFPSLIYPAALVSDPGMYSLTLSTLCPGQTDSCLCILQWLQPDCDTCYCGGFSDMFIRTHAGLMNQPVACGDSALILPCPDPGMAFQLTGVFACVGDSCAPDHQIDWLLTGPGGSNGGSFNDNDPYFGISLLPNWFSQPGLYTLSLQGFCGGDTCICEMSFLIDCPDLCPCDIDDILQLSQDVSKGFAVAVSTKSCNACFSPLALNDCVTVEWWEDGIAGPPDGTTTGAQTYCHSFNGPGTYNVTMVVTQLKPDGSLCESFTHSQTVQVNCIGVPPCPMSIFDNPGLNEGSVAGQLGMGGECPGWVALHDVPVVMEGVDGSTDGWSVLLTGCYFNSDILQSAEPVCIFKKDEGLLIAMRIWGDPHIDSKDDKKWDFSRLTLALLGKDAAEPPCDKYALEDRRTVILHDLLPFEEDAWYELTVPFDLSNWDAQDSCGDDHAGVPLHLAMWVDNLLSSDQGDGNIREAILVDEICMDGELVALDPTGSAGSYRLWPNPGRESIRVELPEPALPGTRLRMVNLTGQTVADQVAAIGQSGQDMTTSGLSPGMYFLVIERNGMTRAILRWVCQE